MMLLYDDQLHNSRAYHVLVLKISKMKRWFYLYVSLLHMLSYLDKVITVLVNT